MIPSAADLSPSELAGQLIVGGFEGTTLPAGVATALAERRLGGVILFKRNLPTIETAWELCREVAEIAPVDLPPFIGVDEEGGRVRRMPPPTVQLPPMRRLGSVQPDVIEQALRVLGSQVVATGFNLNFAPVLDVDSNPQNPVIGDRAFGNSVDDVVVAASAAARGLRAAGLLTCGKHFPGHGDTDKDSHFDLPLVSHDVERLRCVEISPFARLAPELDALMSAHVLYPALDEHHPATLSSAVATGLLREDLGFRGVLFSDDLEMRALAARMPIEESAVRATRAGCDALLICRHVEWQDRAQRALAAEIEREPGFRSRCEAAVNRGLLARRRCPPAPAPSEETLRSAFETAEADAVAAKLT